MAIKKEVKRKLVAGLGKDELYLIKVSDQEKITLLKWKHEREFEFKGQMYDIVETEIKNDTTYYWCIWDSEETALYKKRKALVADLMATNPLKKENQKKLLTFFKSIYFFESFKNKKTDFNESTVKFYFKKNLYSSVRIRPPTHPPEAL